MCISLPTNQEVRAGTGVYSILWKKEEKGETGALETLTGNGPYAEVHGVLVEKPDAVIRGTIAAGSKRCLSGN
jgi:hypothetical protein